MRGAQLKLNPSEFEKVRVRLSGPVFYRISKIRLRSSGRPTAISTAVQDGCLFHTVVGSSRSDVRSSVFKRATTKRAPVYLERRGPFSSRYRKTNEKATRKLGFFIYLSNRYRDKKFLISLNLRFGEKKNLPLRFIRRVPTFKKFYLQKCKTTNVVSNE